MGLLLPTNGKVLKASNEILPFDHPLLDYQTGIVSSPKKDGNRGLCICGSLYTSSMKLPRNPEIHNWLAPLAEYCERNSLVMDYEIYDTAASHHSVISGLINSDGYPVPDTYRAYVFDAAPAEAWENECRDYAYAERIELYKRSLADLGRIGAATEETPALGRYVALPQRSVCSAAEAQQLFLQDLENGDEGSMLRSLYISQDGNRFYGGWYKHGRATNNQRIMWKHKLFETADGVIIAVDRRRKMREDWPREYAATGRLIRPLTKDAYELDNKVGAFTVSTVDEKTGNTVETELMFGKGGFNHLWLEKAWDDYCRDPYTLVGRVVEFRHMPHGAKEGGKRRIGQVLRFRDDLTPEDVGLPHLTRSR